MRANRIGRLAFSSTGSVYGEAKVIPTPEDAPFPVQTSLYGASKAAGEALIAAYCEGFGFRACIFRFVSILGERYTHGHVFDFYRQLRTDGTRLKVLGNETFSPELKDFTALIAKVRAAKADIVYISSYDNASVPLVQQMRQLKVRAMDVHHTMLTGALARQVGADIDGMTGELSWYPGVKGAYSELVETVMQRSNVTMFDYIWTLSRLTSYLAMVQGIEKAGVVDREKVREALFKATIKSPAGDVTFDERGFPNTGAFTVQMQNGKVNVVWPPEIATGKLAWPSPSWQQ